MSFTEFGGKNGIETIGDQAASLLSVELSLPAPRSKRPLAGISAC